MTERKAPCFRSMRITGILELKVEILRNSASLYQTTSFMGQILNSKRLIPVSA